MMLQKPSLDQFQAWLQHVNIMALHKVIPWQAKVVTLIHIRATMLVIIVSHMGDNIKVAARHNLPAGVIRASASSRNTLNKVTSNNKE